MCLRTQAVGTKAQLLTLCEGHVFEKSENLSFIAQILFELSQKKIRGKKGMLIVTILNCNYGKCNHYGKWTYGKCYFRQTFMASAIMAELFITKVLWHM